MVPPEDILFQLDSFRINDTNPLAPSLMPRMNCVNRLLLPLLPPLEVGCGSSTGTQVILENLARSPHLNKKHGTVLQYQAQTLRYLIQLETDISTSFITTTPPPPPVVSIKAENVLQPLKVQIVNLRTQPFYNGKVGTICAYIRPINRYVIKIESYSFLSTSSREISIQPCNIRIPNGTLVRLEGLEYASQWNGKYGTIVRFVEGGSGLTRGGGGQGTTELVESGRYLVCLSRQYGVLVKVENVFIDFSLIYVSLSF